MTIRTYLSIVCVLLVVSVGAGVYVWYVYQTVEQSKTISRGEEVTNIPLGETREKDEHERDTRDVDTTLTGGQSRDSVPSVTRTADTLSEKQRVILEDFGVGDARDTITETMILCIRNSTGDLRFEEILGGSAPTPVEALTIGVCIKKG